MDNSIRKPFQGVWNIVRFNWHYYALAALVVVFILILQHYFNALSVAANILVLLIVCSTFISLAVSCYIYDFSDLYKLSWLNGLKHSNGERIINIHAGFDETSELLRRKFDAYELIVADFYDPAKHTEVSIKRARKTYPPFPNTKQVSTRHLPIQDSSADKIFTIFSAHEIRNDEENGLFQRITKGVETIWTSYNNGASEGYGKFPCL